jgi:lipopolysaccharide transport system permease protein
MIGMMIYYHFVPTINIWVVPLLLLLTVVAAVAVSLWLSAMNVLYRDVGYVTPFLQQMWLYITPIAYPASLVPEKWQMLYALNPMTGVVEGFRWALLGTTPNAPINLLLISSGVSLVMLVTGLFYFRRMERLFADMV